MSAACFVETDPAPRSSPAILVVEDDALVRMVAAGYLRDSGFEVVEAGNAEEAIRVLEAAIKVDLVFSDITMPGNMDGFGLVGWLHRERPDVKVILTSGMPRDAGALASHAPLIAKPYTQAELERRIREMLAR